MALSPSNILSKFRLKPSTSLKASKIAIFTILSLMTLQASTSALLWYANKVRASGGIVFVNNITAPAEASPSYLTGPQDVATDASGNLYIADHDNNRILKLSSAGAYISQITYAGSPGETNKLYHPDRVAVDSSGNVYATSEEYIGANGVFWQGYVLKFDANGDFLWRVGESGTGNGQWDGVGGGMPADIAVDGSGNLFVSSDVRVQKFDSNGGYLSTIGQAGTANGEFTYAKGLAFDSQGVLYVADYNYNQGTGSYAASRIQKFNSNGTFNSKIITSQPNQNSNWTTSFYGQITIDSSDRVYAYGDGPINPGVNVFTSTGQYIETITGGSYNSDHYLLNPANMVAKGNLIYITDPENNRVQVYQNSSVLSIDVPTNSNLGSCMILNICTSDITLSGAQGNVSVTTISGSLPSDFSLNVASNTTVGLSGFARTIPDVGLHTFTLQFQDDVTTVTKEFTYTILPSDFVITTASLDDGTAGQSYSKYIETNMPTKLDGQPRAAQAEFSIASGNLPSGLALDSGTGLLSGTPAQAGDYNFTVQARTCLEYWEYENGTSTILVCGGQAPYLLGQVDVTQAYSLHIAPGGTPDPLDIITTSLPDGELSTAYNQNIYVNNAVSSIDYSVISGSLPTGLSLTPGDAYVLLSGTPTVSGTYDFTLQAQDSRGAGDGTDTQAYTIVIPSLPALNITTTSLPDGRVGAVYGSSSISYENAQAQPVFTVLSGSLPNGLSLSLGGTITGTPTVAGTFNFTVQADDGFNTDAQALSITVLPAIVQHTNTPFVTITSPPNNVNLTTNSMAITGTGPLNQTITLFIDGAQVGTTTTNGSGNWSYTATNITAGNHTFDAKWIPGADVAFVPYVDGQSGQSAIQVINTADNSVAKTIWMLNGTLSLSATINHAGTKLYVVATGEGEYAQLAEVDLNSAAIRTLDLPDYSVGTRVLVSPNDATGYLFVYESGGQTEYNKIVQIDLATLAQLPGSTVLSTRTSGSSISFGQLGLALNPSGSKLYSAASGDLGATQGVGVSIYDTATAQVSTLLLDPNDQAATGIWSLTISGKYLYAVDTAGDGNVRVIVVDTDNDTVVARYTTSIVASAPGYVPTIAVDATRTHAYFLTSTGIAVMALPSGAIVTTIPVSSPMVFGMSFANSGDSLYAIQVMAGILAARTSDNSLLNNTSSLLPPGVFSYSLGEKFLGPITPPKDSINFSLAAVPPNCSTTNTCPADCTVTNTCPVDCTVTNTCPVTPVTTCADTNTCPVVITPTVIVPKATPVGPAAIQGKLGWFDRSILALASFIPAKAAIGFPWLLFLLLLLFALSLYYQSRNEIRKEKLNKEFIGKRHSVRQQQDNFIALASHYLNTPITIIQNGVEMMRSQVAAPAQPAQSAKPARPVAKPSPTIPVNSKGAK